MELEAQFKVCRSPKNELSYTSFWKASKEKGPGVQNQRTQDTE